MGLSGRRPSLGRPPPVGAAMRRADASMDSHSGRVAGHQLLEATNLSGAASPCTVAPAAPPAGRVRRYDSLAPQMDTSDVASLMRAASAEARDVAASDARNEDLVLLAICTPAYVRDRAAQE